MTAGDMPDGVGHGQNRQAEGERDADESDAEVWETSGQHRSPTTPKHQPEGSKDLGRDTPRHIHDRSSPSARSHAVSIPPHGQKRTNLCSVLVGYTEAEHCHRRKEASTFPVRSLI